MRLAIETRGRVAGAFRVRSGHHVPVRHLARTTHHTHRRVNRRTGGPRSLCPSVHTGCRRAGRKRPPEARPAQRRDDETGGETTRRVANKRQGDLNTVEKEGGKQKFKHTRVAPTHIHTQIKNWAGESSLKNGRVLQNGVKEWGRTTTLSMREGRSV
jgi:hypothetical protein